MPRRLSRDEFADLGAAAYDAFIRGPEAMASFLRTTLVEAVGRDAAMAIVRDHVRPDSELSGEWPGERGARVLH